MPGLTPMQPTAASPGQCEDAVITLPAIAGRPGAGYFTLATNVDPTRLVAISSPAVERIELHQTISENGRSRMVTIDRPAFSPATPLRFEPGGRHLMLFGIDPSLRPGDHVRLSFRFDPAPPVEVEAEIRAAGDAGHEGH